MRLLSTRSLSVAASILIGSVAAAQTPVVATSTLSVRTLSVASIANAGAADLIVLAGGHSDGWRQGMTATVERNGATIAQVCIAELRRDRAVALITILEAGSVIQAGDRVVVNALL
jgi:Iap family predicted aminopeptidase